MGKAEGAATAVDGVGSGDDEWFTWVVAYCESEVAK